MSELESAVMTGLMLEDAVVGGEEGGIEGFDYGVLVLEESEVGEE